MFSLDIRHDDRVGISSPDALVRSADDLVHRWPDLPPPLLLTWSDLPVIALDGEVPWLYGPAGDDPLFGQASTAVLPRRQRALLRKRAVAGPRFDAVAVAHELDPGGEVKALLPALRKGPLTCSSAVARDLVGPPPSHPGVAGAARLLDTVVRIGSWPALTPAIDALLDPLVFGIVAPSGLTDGLPALWFPLAAWRW